MRISLNGTLFFVLLLTFFVGFQGIYADEAENLMEKTVDGYTVKLIFSNPEVTRGKNTVIVSVKDNQNMPLEKILVTLSAEMDNASAMDMNMTKVEPLNSTLKEQYSGNTKGEYLGELNFNYKGEWVVTAKFTDRGKEMMVDFHVTVAQGGPNWIVLGVVFGIIGIVILIGALWKLTKGKKK